MDFSQEDDGDLYKKTLELMNCGKTKIQLGFFWMVRELVWGIFHFLRLSHRTSMIE